MVDAQPAQFARDLLAHLRHLLVTQTIGEVPGTFVVTATDEGRITAQAHAIGAATLVRTIDELSQALTAVREGDDARMAGQAIRVLTESALRSALRAAGLQAAARYAWPRVRDQWLALYRELVSRESGIR